MILLFLVYEKTERSTSFDFLASLGGFFGLFLGVSFLSIIEIFYWFIIKLGRRSLAKVEQ